MVPRYLKNLQILSALIWAFTIIVCSWLSDKSNISTVLITAAGFHVLLLTQFAKCKPESQIR